MRVRGVGRIPARVVDQSAGVLRVLFDWNDEAMRERMIVKLFASGAHDVGLRQASLAQILAATWRRAFGITWLDGYNLRHAAAAQGADTSSDDTMSTPPVSSFGESASAPPRQASAGG